VTDRNVKSPRNKRKEKENKEKIRECVMDIMFRKKKKGKIMKDKRNIVKKKTWTPY
jgi:hypothetical protein